MILDAYLGETLVETFTPIVARTPWDTTATITAVDSAKQAIQVDATPVGVAEDALLFSILEFGPGHAAVIRAADLTPPGDPALGWRGPLFTNTPNQTVDSEVRLWSGPIVGARVYFGGGPPHDKTIVFASLDTRDESSAMGSNGAVDYGTKEETLDFLCAVQMAIDGGGDALVSYTQTKREFIYLVDQVKWILRGGMPSTCRNVQLVGSPRSYFPDKGRWFFRADLRLQWRHRI